MKYLKFLLFFFFAELIQRKIIELGEKLSDMLSISIKNALGAPIQIDYSEDIANVRDTLDAIVSRRNIFNDSLQLQKVTLKQISYIHAYEKEATVAKEWLKSLFVVLTKSHTHVGCTVSEIQKQKDEHQSFQDTAKVIFKSAKKLV